MDGEEVYFSLYCFFNDFQEVRTHIRQSWADYIFGDGGSSRRGDHDQCCNGDVAAGRDCMCSSKAFPQKYKLNGYEEVARFLILIIATSRGVDPNSLRQIGIEHSFHLDLEDIA
ncbi:unnamed protein product [Calypogeia fissa]